MTIDGFLGTSDEPILSAARIVLSQATHRLGDPR
jgi:hypothetical protein